MAEMTRRERLMAATVGKPTDKLPFFHYWRHSQVGWAEREARNRGMGINWTRPCYTETMHGVELSEKRVVSDGRPVIRRTYSTPVGSMFLEELREPGTGQWHAERSWKDIAPWHTIRLVKGEDDYKVLKYIVENTEYNADYFPIEQAMDWLGDEGVVMDALPHSPMQMLMIDWVGSDEGRFFYHHADWPEIVEETYQTISDSRQQMYEIAAKSPAPITLCGDNLDGFLVSPKLFEKYFMPEYEKEGKVIHDHGKLMAVHMDGRVGSLRDLITRTPVDIVEALHPPPMGDISIGEALDLWPDKAVWVGFPAAIYELGPAETKRYAIEFLRGLGTGERMAVAMSTENLVSNENLLTLTSVLEKIEMPLTPDKIDEIEAALT
ncbi:MAG: hypothetical protein QGG34_17050 [SAR202 cluster bacterium]|jgi:hypothetical protein|nr:hypothetical protein [SAR202 cluster bacterium]MDP6302163.1 hypothetical protein [SAR202 cluster bacterium]MDP7105245.1 hypothetical protein [SAR202 cluster bacterium]HJO83232.1 hypothetical protein [SAR202 cluster bacterium]